MANERLSRRSVLKLGAALFGTAAIPIAIGAALPIRPPWGRGTLLRSKSNLCINSTGRDTIQIFEHCEKIHDISESFSWVGRPFTAKVLGENQRVMLACHGWKFQKDGGVQLEWTFEFEPLETMRIWDLECGTYRDFPVCEPMTDQLIEVPA